MINDISKQNDFFILEISERNCRKYSSKSLSILVFYQMLIITAHHFIVLQNEKTLPSPFKACSSNDTILLMLISQQVSFIAEMQ